jgi:hypothetical protein
MGFLVFNRQTFSLSILRVYQTPHARKSWIVVPQFKQVSVVHSCICSTEIYLCKIPYKKHLLQLKIAIWTGNDSKSYPALLIRVRIGPPHPLCVVRGDWMSRSLGWNRKTEVPCHSRYGTIKIPPCSKALSAEHRPKFRNHGQWWHLPICEKFLSRT